MYMLFVSLVISDKLFDAVNSWKGYHESRPSQTSKPFLYICTVVYDPYGPSRVLRSQPTGSSHYAVTSRFTGLWGCPCWNQDTISIKESPDYLPTTVEVQKLCR